MANVDDALEYALAVMLTVSLISAVAAFWLLSCMVWPVEGPTPLHVIYDSPSSVITYVDGVECPVCGRGAIATTQELVCNNEGCAAYGVAVRRAGEDR